MKTHVTIATMLLGIIGCQQDAEPTGRLDTEMRDSAGIRIVENAQPPAGSRLGWRIGPEPSVSIGVLEGDDPYMLFAVRDATILSDGRIIVANAGTIELRVFDAEGTYLDTWGGEGEGPGEFTNLRHIEPLPNDSVIVWGWLDPTMTVFDPAGNFSRSVRSDRSAADPPTPYIGPLSATRDGLIIAGHDPVWVEGNVVVEVWDTEGNFRGSMGTHEGLQPRTRVGNINYTMIFGRTLTLEPWGEFIVIGSTDRYEFKAFLPDGTLARIVRRDHVRRAPTDAHQQAYIDGWVDGISSEMVELKAQTRSNLRSVPVAEFFPAYTSVVADALDHLWVREYEAPGEETPGVLWTVFDSEGRVLGFVETPEALEIYEIGADYIVGKTEDEEFGVESVQVWRLERSGR